MGWNLHQSKALFLTLVSRYKANENLRTKTTKGGILRVITIMLTHLVPPSAVVPALDTLIIVQVTSLVSREDSIKIKRFRVDVKFKIHDCSGYI